MDAADAGMTCAPHAQIVQQIERDFKVTRLGSGLTASGNIILEIYTNPDGIWTVVITKPHSPSCILDGGDNWQTELPGNPS